MFRSILAVLFIAAFSFSYAFAQADPATAAPSPSPSPAAEPSPDAVTTPSVYTPPTGKVRFKRYVNSTVGPFSWARLVFAAGTATWRNSPEEWGGQWEGFGKRVASNFGRNVIKQTTIYGLDEALKLDSSYYRAKGKGPGAKIKNALLSPVTARTRSGKRTIGIPRIAGTYTGAIVAYETWFPDRYDWKDGVRRGTFSLGFNAAFNLVKEFVWKK